MAMTSQTPFQIQENKGSAQGYEETLGPQILKMVLVPGGNFLMGSASEELDRFNNEGPQHPVDIPSFFMTIVPVTQDQWRVVATMKEVKQGLDSDPSDFKGGERPVEQVSWNDAVEFCARLARETTRPYRLPTEAEWEYACRAKTTTPFHFGDTITTDLANYCGSDESIYSGSYGNGPKGLYREETTDAGSFNCANNFGLYDMHGNVWEWCEDHWHGNYTDAPQHGEAWLTNNNDARRVVRGGSWDNLPRNCRSACRNGNTPDGRLNKIGFRVVCCAPRALP